MKSIHLDDRLRIDITRYNFTLREKQMSKPTDKYPEGREGWVTLCHHSGVAGILQELPTHILKRRDVNSFREASAALERLTDAITRKVLQ